MTATNIPLKYIADSIKGTQRIENKDRTLVLSSEDYLLAILFDGISSAAEANKGIGIAVDFIEKNYSLFYATDKWYDLSSLMFEAHRAAIQPELNDPYATFNAVCVSRKKEWAVFSNLGDSRTYEVTPQYIKQRSKDDNLLHNKNVVTKYLGMIELKKEDFLVNNFDVADKRILLCSDGFYSLLEEDRKDFHSILNFDRPGYIKKALFNKISGKNLDDSSYIFVF